MSSGSSRLDRFISRQTGQSLRDVKLLISQKKIIVNGEVAESVNTLVDQFSQIEIGNTSLDYQIPTYIMLNKPIGVVSATVDSRHTTVIDLIRKKDFFVNNLHIPGRLDFNSTGLLLMTNDGRWSKQLSDPAYNISKCYEVTVDKDIADEYITVFNRGMYFEHEEITTRPAQLEILSSRKARVFLTEGRYHQIRRMFGHFQNKVLTLKRVSIGNLTLDEGLKEGESRALTQDEVNSIISV